MGIERLAAEIANLTSDEDDAAWQHNGRTVAKIKLPLVGQAGLAFVDGNVRFDATANAEVRTEGSVFGTDVGGSDLMGYFVGDTGEDVFGTWAIGDLLDGVFVANRQSISRATLPSAPDNNGLSVAHNNIPSSDLTSDGTARTIQISNAPAECSGESNETDDVFWLSQFYGGATVTRTEAIETGDNAVIHPIRGGSHTVPGGTPTKASSARGS